MQWCPLYLEHLIRSEKWLKIWYNTCMKGALPTFAWPYFWSDRIEELDLDAHKNHIIKQILDHGSEKATDWVRSTYSDSDIRGVIENTPASAWSRKSLALWSLMYKSSPKTATRFS